MDSQCGDIRPALKAVATSLVRKNMAKNIQVSVFVLLASRCGKFAQPWGLHCRDMLCLGASVWTASP